MRNEFPRHIKTGKLNPVTVILNGLKNTTGNSGRRLSAATPRKFTVNIHIFHTPVTFPYIHGITVDHRNHQNFLAGTDTAITFQLLKYPHQLGTNIELLYLIPPHGSQNTGCFISFAKAVSLHHHSFPVGRLHPVYFIYIHSYPLFRSICTPIHCPSPCLYISFPLQPLTHPSPVPGSVQSKIPHKQKDIPAG